jgi:hypothetical protein
MLISKFNVWDFVTCVKVEATRNVFLGICNEHVWGMRNSKAELTKTLSLAVGGFAVNKFKKFSLSSRAKNTRV